MLLKSQRPTNDRLTWCTTQGLNINVRDRSPVVELASPVFQQFLLQVIYRRSTQFGRMYEVASSSWEIDAKWGMQLVRKGAPTVTENLLLPVVFGVCLHSPVEGWLGHRVPCDVSPAGEAHC